MPKISRTLLVVIVIVSVLFFDQALKIWIKTNMVLHDGIQITDWFILFFTENNGMAFGIELFDKLFLTLFRIIAVGVLIWYIQRIQSFPTVRTGYLVAVALITAGAAGNIIDCLFYGVIFDDSLYQVATLFPENGGYSSFFYGKVVDMFYFPIIDTVWPDWLPFFGGKPFVFFQPVFNLADASISVGIVVLLLFYRRELSETTTSKALKRPTTSSGQSEDEAV